MGSWRDGSYGRIIVFGVRHFPPASLKRSRVMNFHSLSSWRHVHAWLIHVQSPFIFSPFSYSFAYFSIIITYITNLIGFRVLLTMDILILYLFVSSNLPGVFSFFFFLTMQQTEKSQPTSEASRYSTHC